MPDSHPINLGREILIGHRGSCSSAFDAVGNTLGEANFDNLKLRIMKACPWVDSQSNNLCDILTRELEKESYESLLVREHVSYRVQTIDEISKNRKEK